MSVEERVRKLEDCVQTLTGLVQKLALGAEGGEQQKGTSISLSNKLVKWTATNNVVEIPVDKSTLQGRIVSLVNYGFFAARHNRKEIVEELSNRGWLHDPKEVDAALLELCSLGLFIRKISTGNTFWFNLTPEAQSLIR